MAPASETYCNIRLAIDELGLRKTSPIKTCGLKSRTLKTVRVRLRARWYEHETALVGTGNGFGCYNRCRALKNNRAKSGSHTQIKDPLNAAARGTIGRQSHRCHWSAWHEIPIDITRG